MSSFHYNRKAACILTFEKRPLSQGDRPSYSVTQAPSLIPKILTKAFVVSALPPLLLLLFHGVGGGVDV